MRIEAFPFEQVLNLPQCLLVICCTAYEAKEQKINFIKVDWIRKCFYVLLMTKCH